MKITHQSIFGSALLLALSAPAYAHNGEHTAPFLANILHWLSSPTHALYSVLGTTAVIISLAAMRRRRS